MNDLEKKIYDDVLDDFEYVRSLRRYFHTHPELSNQEYHTCERIEEELEKIGLTHKRVNDTSVITEIKGDLKGSKSIILRADIDALPILEEHDCEYKSQNGNVMHACGHDAHIAGLLGACRVLVKNKDKFGGTVRVHFQKAEEIGCGGKQIVKSGVCDNADRCFGIHMAPDMNAGEIALVEGPNNAAVDWFRLTVKGKQAHICKPENGIDSLYIGSEIVVALQSIITKRIPAMEKVLIGIGKFEAGSAYNVIAKDAKIEGTIRTFNEEIRAQIKEDIVVFATKIANSYGATIEFETKDNTCPVINDPIATHEAQKVAISLFGKDKVNTTRSAALTGDDFAEYLRIIPGVYGFIGSKNDKVFETTVALHNSHFDIDENCLKVSASMFASYAIEFLNGSIK